MLSMICLISVTTFAMSNNGKSVGAELSSRLAGNENFIRDIEINQNLFTHTDSTDNILTSEEYDQMVKGVGSVETLDELVNTFARYKIILPEDFSTLINEKISLWKNIVNDFPELKELSVDDRMAVIKDAIHLVRKNAPGCSNKCCNSYVADQGDCDDAFAAELGWTMVGGFAAGLISGGTATTAVILIGVGHAYSSHYLCMRSTVRHYRDCMGYD
jgi:hypothetical protein